MDFSQAHLNNYTHSIEKNILDICLVKLFYDIIYYCNFWGNLLKPQVIIFFFHEQSSYHSAPPLLFRQTLLIYFIIKILIKKTKKSSRFTYQGNQQKKTLCWIYYCMLRKDTGKIGTNICLSCQDFTKHVTSRVSFTLHLKKSCFFQLYLLVYNKMQFMLEFSNSTLQDLNSQ